MENSPIPTVMRAVPTIGKILYRPIRAMICPLPIEAVNSPAMMGNNIEPGGRRRNTSDDLEVYGQVDDRAEHCDADDESGGVRHREDSLAEQPERDDRLGGVVLTHEECSDEADADQRSWR